MSAESEPKNVMIYARYSSDLQNDRSIEDQVAACRRSLKDNEIVAHVFSDRASRGAFIRNRPGIQSLIRQIEAEDCAVILAESLDRISRTVENADHIYRLACFHNVVIRTLMEGEITQMHICFHGAVGSVQLEQTVERTRRGQIGNILAGKAGGGLAYGYRVRHLNDEGVPEPGLREIDPEKAEIVRSIYRDYADGVPALRIIKRLNEAGVPSPKGGKWRTTTIAGHFERKDGILQNPIYRGELVWGRCPEIRHPGSARRVVRVEDEDHWIRQRAKHLRIVDDNLWFRVQERRAEVHSKHAPAAVFEKFGVACRCERCGAGMIQPGRGYLVCETYKHHQLCTNNRRYAVGEVTDRVFAHLESLPYTRWQDWTRDNAESWRRAVRRLMETGREVERSLDGGITQEALTRNRHSLEVLCDLQKELERMPHPSKPCCHETFLAELGKAGTPKRKDMFIRRYIDSLTLDRTKGGRIVITELRPNFAAIAKLSPE